MLGRSCVCLLAMIVLLLTPARLWSQSGGGSVAANVRVPAVPVGPVGAPAPVELRGRLPIPPVVARRPIGFPAISNPAGTIFSGTVTGIARQPASSGQPIETVAITFHVERAIRGTSAGQELTILQWIGLWSAGQRYRVGERVLLFLYPPSKLGLTSCVAGAMGRFTVDPTGRVLLTAQHLSSFRADPVLGGKSRVRLSDFSMAVQRAGGED